ncbi:hypothetical protein JTE90_019786 [Oedothorax gibbosus]|uniref:Uncharacterized protein n=1 Tax=Oedothorax gibbosus TaxID=931172 RepID=A0AAV6V502_9ARAC|nr:hypothetical protein JTE90_019786 [Oedothorax gibbosus]
MTPRPSSSDLIRLDQPFEVTVSPNPVISKQNNRLLKDPHKGWILTKLRVTPLRTHIPQEEVWFVLIRAVADCPMFTFAIEITGENRKWKGIPHLLMR